MRMESALASGKHSPSLNTPAFKPERNRWAGQYNHADDAGRIKEAICYWTNCG
jgi:hypothetical protein